MAKKKILIITDEPKTANSLKEILGEYEFKAEATAENALISASEFKPDLIILDYDLKGVDGLQFFRQINALVPQAKVIMLTILNNIPLAVSATKLGVSDFIRKPLDTKQFCLSVQQSLAFREGAVLPPAGITWLQGNSSKLKQIYSDIKTALAASRNILIFGEIGIEKREIATLVHSYSPRKKRQLRILDLSSFQREDLEAHFWGSLSARNEDDRAGTLYLDQFDGVEENFKLSVLEFFRSKKTGAESDTLIVIGMRRGKVEYPMEKDFALIEIPSLRERKEDLPFLLGQYCLRYSAKHNKTLKGFSTEALDYLMLYDYPGNYRELECIIEQAVLHSTSEIIELKDLPLDFQWVLDAAGKKSFRAGKLQLKDARRKFENELYGILLAKSGGDATAVARFMDVPRTSFTERLEDLSADLPD